MRHLACGRYGVDAELNEYADGLQGPIAKAASAAGNWVKDNWEYVAGGAMVIAGGVLMATGVGGPAGTALLSAGADTIMQKATTGEVNWGQVAVGAAFGAFGGGAASSFGKQILRDAAEGALESVANYAFSGEPLTAEGFLLSAATGGATAAFSSGVMGALPTDKLPIAKLADEPPTPTNKIYSANVLERMSEDKFHDFPGMFDETIFAEGNVEIVRDYFNKPKQNLSNDTIRYTLSGSGNGKPGEFQIFTRPSTSGRTELITHRAFIPFKKS